MAFLTITDCDLTGKRVLIREDFNVPMQNGHITSDARLRAALPSIEYALQQGAAVLLMSHLGRPIAGQFDPAYSLEPIAAHLSELLNKPVRFSKEWLQGVQITPGEIVLCENVRFQSGEEENDDHLSQQLAALCDVFVMDAFGAAHRAHASTYGVARYAPVACAGLLLASELTALSKALQQPKKPIVAIVGGSKVSTKLKVLESLIHLADYVIVGGGIANTFIAAQGFSIGKSLAEIDLIPTAQHLLKLAADKGCQIPLPSDVKVAQQFSAEATATSRNVNAVQENEMILDIGEQTAQHFAELIDNAHTIIWNGPVGVFEFPAFAQGSTTLAHAIATSKAFSIAGGGDTLALIDQLHLHDKISYVSTGGGAFLEFLENNTLPAIDALQR